MSDRLQYEKEKARVAELSEFDLDYGQMEDAMQDLTALAASIAGTPISFINLLDAYTQWTVAHHGPTASHMPREESVCDHTIRQSEPLEVPDLSADARFHERSFVTQPPFLKYYFGVPLQTPAGNNIGALCVLDTEARSLSQEKQALLQLVANTVVRRLLLLRKVQRLESELKAADETKRKLAHDTRGPLGGIVGLTNVISQQGDSNQLAEMLEYIELIRKSSNSLLDLTDNILNTQKYQAVVDKREPATSALSCNLTALRDKLLLFYEPQAALQQLGLTIDIAADAELISFQQAKLLQIAGNLLSHALRNASPGGEITLILNLRPGRQGSILYMDISWSSTETSPQPLETEENREIGLALVHELVAGMKGTLQHSSSEGKQGYHVELPVKRA